MNTDEAKGYQMALRNIQTILFEELERIRKAQAQAKNPATDAVCNLVYDSLGRIAKRVRDYTQVEIELSKYESSNNEKH